MPTPTQLLDFGEENTGSDNVFCLVSLDDSANVDLFGTKLTEFLDTELVYILVHIESGARVHNIRTSYGTINNPLTPRSVVRSHTIEEVVFDSAEETYQIPHIPIGGVTPTFYGHSAIIARTGRILTVNAWPRICDITYQYQAWQYELQVPDLNIVVGEDFPLDVSFDVRK